MRVMAYFGFGPGDGIFIAAFIIIAVAVFAFEVYMLIHAIKNRALSSNTKLLWIVGMLIIHPLVAIAYYFTDYKKGI